MLQAHADTEQTLPDLEGSLRIFSHVSIEDAPFWQDVSAKKCSNAWLFFLKGCTKTACDLLRAASNLVAKASGARESLPQLICVALHATNLGQLLKDVPFFLVRKTLLERSLFVADTLAPRRETW